MSLDRAHPWIIPLRTAPAPALRLLCLPHAGGWPSSFAAWAGQLPPGVELLVAQLPGRGSRLYEPPLTTVAAIVDQLLVAIEPLTALPYVLVGHSFGSVLGFELARRLSLRWGRAPRQLIVSARQPPHIPSRAPFVHQYSDAELTSYLQRLGGIPDAIAQRDELLVSILRAIRADFQALETYSYTPGPPLALPLSVYGAIDDPVVAWRGLDYWAEHTTGPFQLQLLTGEHFYFYQQLNARRIVEQIFATEGNATHPATA